MTASPVKIRWVRRFFYTTTVFACLLPVLGVLLQTPPGKFIIARTVSHLVTSHTKYTLHIDGLSGILPGHIRIAVLDIKDPRGDLATLHNLDVRLDVSALLRGQVHVNALTLEHLELWRRPIPRERWRIPRLPGLPAVESLRVDRITLDAAVLGTPAVLGVTGSLRPIVDSLLPEISLDVKGLDVEGIHGNVQYTIIEGMPSLSLAVEDNHLLPALLEVTPPVKIDLDGRGTRSDWNASLKAVSGDAGLAEGTLHIGEAQDTTLEAALHINTGALACMRKYTGMTGNNIAVNAAATLDRQGVLHISPAAVTSETAKLTLNGAVDFEQDSLALEAAADYDNMSRFFASIPGEVVLPLHAATTLQGPFTAPEMRLQATVNEADVLKGSVQLHLDTQIAAQGRLQLTPPVLLSEITGLTPDDEANLNFSVSYAEDSGALEITAIEAIGMGLNATLQGAINPALPSLDMNIAFSTEDAGLLGKVLSQPLQGAVKGSAEVKADAAHLDANAALNMNEIQINKVQFKEGLVEATAQWDNWYSTSPENMEVIVNASTSLLQFSGMKPVNLKLNTAMAGETLEAIQINALSLTDENITITGTGTLNAITMTSKVNLETAVSRVSALPVEVTGLPDGALHLQTQLETRGAPFFLTTKTTGTFEDINGLPATAAVVIADKLSFDMDVTLAEGRLEVEAAKIGNDTLTLDGKGNYTLESGELQGELTAVLPDLQRTTLSDTHPVSGTILVNASVAGILPKISLNAKIEGKNIVYGVMPPTHLLLDVAATDIPATTTATIAGNVASGETTLSLNANTTVKDDVLIVEPFAVSTGKNKISGNMFWPLKEGLPEANVAAAVEDIHALAGMAGYDIRGRGEASLHLEGTTAKLTATANELRYGTLSAEKVESSVVVTGFQNKPTGNITLEVGNIGSDAVLLNRLVIKGQGDAGEITLSASTKGRFTVVQDLPSDIECETVVRVFPKEHRLYLGRTRGMLGIFPVSLEADTSLTFANGGFELAPMVLRIGDGTVHAGILMEDDALQGNCRLEKLPLALSRLFSPAAITGVLDGSIVFGGTPDNPAIETTLAVSEARLDLENAAAVAPMTARLQSRLLAGRLEASVAADMKDIMTVEAQGSLPVSLHLKPWQFELKPTAPVSGVLSYTLFTAPLFQALEVMNHQLDAKFKGDFTVSGSLQALQASGDAYVEGGQYTNTVAGTHLENLNFHVAAEGSALRLEAFAADAGKDGTVHATGEARLLPAEDFPFSINLQFSNAELSQLNYLNGRVNGMLTIAGNTRETTIGGDLVVGPVYATLPDQKPVSEPTVLDVVEVRDGEIVNDAKSGKANALPQIKLDIRCDIPGRLYMRAPVLDSEWGGKLHVGGLLGEPKLEGRIAVLRGYLDFLGRRFQLRDSAFSFPGGAPKDLWLDMHAVAETPTLSSKLNLTGRLSEVTLQMTSEPTLPQDEILAQVLFGRDLSRISPVQAIQLARVAAMFNKGLAGLQFFSGTIAIPGIDRIDIRTGERADETVVGIGKYLTDSVYMEVEQGTTTDSSKVSVEVEVTPNISVKGDVDAKERSGVGLFWNKDY